MIDQPRADLRGLKALVGIMGVLIVLGTALVIGVVIHRLYAKVPVASNAPPIPAALAAAPPVAGTVPAGTGALAPGEQILGIAGAGSKIAVWVRGPGGDRLLLVDPASGAVGVALGGR